MKEWKVIFQTSGNLQLLVCVWAVSFNEAKAKATTEIHGRVQNVNDWSVSDAQVLK